MIRCANFHLIATLAAAAGSPQLLAYRDAAAADRNLPEKNRHSLDGGRPERLLLLHAAHLPTYLPTCYSQLSQRTPVACDL